MPDGPQQDLSNSDEIDGPSVTAVADEPAVVREKAPEINPGDLLANRYQVEAILGKGGSGVVLRAFDRSAQALVAVKLLRPTLTHDPRWERRFSRELRLGRPIRHPNVCRVFDIAEADGYRFLTMELATGGTLRELIKRNEPLRSMQERLADAASVIGGLAAIHEAGIVHRDVKTDNILRMEDGRLVLSDFGLATDLPTATMVSVFVGTPHYMAPEVREGEPATTRSDVWSLGIVLHEIFFGRRPERRASRSGTSASSIRSAPPVSSTIERAMLALCELCLADDPAERPVDAGTVRELFESAQTSPALFRSRAPKRFRKAVAATAVAAAFLAGAGLYYRSGSSAKGTLPTHPILVPTGKPVDWTDRATMITTIPGTVHCFSTLDERTARVIWGLPRRAEDIDLVSGKHRPSNLLPDTYHAGCPQLSPKGDRVLFSSPTPAGASEIRLSSDATGAGSLAITPGVEPVWLRNGEEFLYSIDPYHAAIFSLPTMGFTLLPDPGLGGRQGISEKIASKTGDMLAVEFVDEEVRTVVAVYEGGTRVRATVVVPSAYELSFDRNDELLVSYRLSRSVSTLAALDWRRGTLRQVGQYRGLDLIRASRQGSGELVALARHRAKDVWLYSSAGRRQLTNDGDTFSAAMSRHGEFLLGKRNEDGTLAIWWQGKDGKSKKVTSGPADVRPDFAPDGRSWTYVDYDRKSIMLCEGFESPCRILRTDDHAPSWPRFSPDGSRLAYVTLIGKQRVQVVSLKDGAVKEIGPALSQCPPVWSTANRLWTFEGSPKNYTWMERDAQTGEVTGGKIRLGDLMNDAMQDADESRCWPPPDHPEAWRFLGPRIETDERFHLVRLPQQQ